MHQTFGKVSSVQDILDVLKSKGYSVHKMGSKNMVIDDHVRTAEVRTYHSVESFFETIDQGDFTDIAIFGISYQRDPQTMTDSFVVCGNAWSVSKKIVVEFYLDLAYGALGGLFITTKEELDSIIGKTIYFGEVMGHHSEVSETMSEEHFMIKTNDQKFIELCEKYFGSNSLNGYNPFDYIKS